MEYDNWVPGDGLILSDHDPYVFSIATTMLEDYVGRYEYKDGGQLELVIQEKDGSLGALLPNGVVYPLYHEEGEVFSDTNSEPVFFVRDASGLVSGYKLSADGPVFARLRIP